MGQRFEELPLGARAAIEQQWLALAAGGLPCGSAIVDADGRLVAAGRNHSYDAKGALDSRLASPLQHNRIAHAELNALAQVSTETDHARLTLWTTQHPCLMCAAAMRFIGVGKACFVADDPSDHSKPEDIVATRGPVPYEALGDPYWWTACNLFFLYNSAVQRGAEAGNLRNNRDRYPDLVRLALDLAKDDALGKAACDGLNVSASLERYRDAIERVGATTAPRRR